MKAGRLSRTIQVRRFLQILFILINPASLLLLAKMLLFLLTLRKKEEELPLPDLLDPLEKESAPLGKGSLARRVSRNGSRRSRPRSQIPTQEGPQGWNLSSPETVLLLARICFALPFPWCRPSCFRRSLLLYHFLSDICHDSLKIHLGISPSNPMDGHAWISMAGIPFQEREDVTRFHVVYQYPSGGHP